MGAFQHSQLPRKPTEETLKSLNLNIIRYIFRLSHEFRKHFLIADQGHPTNKLSQKPLTGIIRLLVIYKACLKRHFNHLEQFDLFGYFS